MSLSTSILSLFNGINDKNKHWKKRLKKKSRNFFIKVEIVVMTKENNFHNEIEMLEILFLLYNLLNVFFTVTRSVYDY
jgi:hypothetical protein